MKTNIIYNEDCLKGMEKMPDNSIDLIITDPPYGDNAVYGRNNKGIKNNEKVDINYKFLDKVYNILKDNSNIYLFTNWKHENDIRNYITKNTQYKIRMVLVIVKYNFGLGYGFRNQHEFCLVLEKGKPKYKMNNFSNVMYMQYIDHDEDTHPHQKGIKIIRKIIKHSSEKGDIILDGFAGSGIIPLAAQQLNRKYIAYEVEQKWYFKTLKRLGKFDELPEKEKPQQTQMF